MVTDLARSWAKNLVEPAARYLGRSGLTPNAITVIGFLLTAAVAAILAAGHLRVAGVLLIFTLGADALDGTLARLTGTTSRFGAFLDSTLDRWAEVLLYVALAWHALEHGNKTGVMLAIATLAASLLVSYTRARAEGVALECKGGLMTRLERLVLLIAGLILGRPFWALWVIALLAGFTAIQRIWLTWQADQRSQEPQ